MSAKPERIYLDNAATTPLAPEAFAAMEPWLKDSFGNASSVYSEGREAKVALEEARNVVANFIGADAREIVFTSGGTESINTALLGTYFDRKLDDFQLVSSKAEHHAVLESAEFLASLGSSLILVEPDSDGRIAPESIPPGADLYSFMLVNNEVGTVTDIAAVAKQIREARPSAIIHTDAVQALGALPIHVRELGVDLLSVSAHKIGGPKGIGALFSRSGVTWKPLIHGGSQERNRRGGTEPVALAVGFAAAVSVLENSWATRAHQIAALHDALWSELEVENKILINSPRENSSKSILNFTFCEPLLSKLDAEALLIRFDLAGIAVSNGSACTSGSMQPSHVLSAMGMRDKVASTSLRVSFGSQNTLSDVAKFMSVLRELIA